MGRTSVAVLLPLVVCALAGRAWGQPLDRTFTYQGMLKASGAPANGVYDLRFRLYSASSGEGQVGPTLCSDNVAVVEGRFTVRLDFGAQYAGQQRYLEVDVRPDVGQGCGDAAGFMTLGPRQALTAAPQAAWAMQAGSADSSGNAALLNGQAAAYYQNAANLTAGTVPDGRLAGTYTGAVTFTNAGNQLTGSGAGLTNVNAAQLGGQAASAYGRLAAAQSWTAGNTFTSAANSFTGSGSGLTGVNAAQLEGFASSAFGRLAAAQAWAGANTFTSAANSFTGSGAGLTGVNAAQLGGLASSAFGRLAVGQTWTGLNYFSNSGNIYVGDGQYLINVNALSVGGYPALSLGRLGSDQTWTAPNVFTSTLNRFTGDGAGLTGVNATALDGHDGSEYLRSVPNPLVMTGATVSVVQVTSTSTHNPAVSSTMSGASLDSNAAAVLGQVTGQIGGSGVKGLNLGNGEGVLGESGTGEGVVGRSRSTSASGNGVEGYALGSGAGVYASGATGYAFWGVGASRFDGDVRVSLGSRLGVGLNTPPAMPLEIGGAGGDKIGLAGSGAAWYGFGVSGINLQIFSPTPSDCVSIGSGSSSAYNERVRFTGAADMIFRNDGRDNSATIQSSYDLMLMVDHDADNTDAWFRVFTDGQTIEQLRILDGNEASAMFDGAVVANGIDYAEAFKAGEDALEAGDLVVGRGDWEAVVRSARAYDPGVVGVVSTRPAFVAGLSFDAEDRMDPALTARRDAARAAGDRELEKTLTLQMAELARRAYRPVAFMGRVPVKVTGPVRVGDHLAASAQPGRAMAMTLAGHSIGIALEASDGGETSVLTLVRPAYFVPEDPIPPDTAALLEQLTGRLNRVLAENEDLRARLDRLEARFAGR